MYVKYIIFTVLCIIELAVSKLFKISILIIILIKMGKGTGSGDRYIFKDTVIILNI
jgi:hypothetical protein